MAKNKKTAEEKEEEKKKKKDKQKKKRLAIILTPFVSIILAAACFLVIIQGIVDIVIGVVAGLLDFVSNPDKVIDTVYTWSFNSINYMFDFGGYRGPESSGFTLILNDDAINNIKENLKSSAIDQDASGLPDTTLKKLILINYMTACTEDMQIGIPLTDEEVKQIGQVSESGRIDSNGVMHFNGKIAFKEGIFIYVKGIDDNNPSQWYICVQGIVKLIDEKGNKIYPYTQENLEEIVKTYQFDYSTNKTNTMNSVKDCMQHAYTLESPGQIKMAKTTLMNNRTTYRYGNDILLEEKLNGGYKTDYITLNYSEYISQYAMPIDFLVSLLEVTGSDGFIDALCDLVGESEIQVVITANESETVDIDSTRYIDNITVKGLQKKQNGQTAEFQNVSVSESITDSIIPGEPVNVMIETRKNTIDTQYDIFVKEVNTWYCKAKYEVNNNWNVRYVSIDEGGNEVVEEKEYTEKNDEDVSNFFEWLEETVKDLYQINEEGNEAQKNFFELLQGARNLKIWIEEKDHETNDIVACSREGRSDLEVYQLSLDSESIKEWEKTLEDKKRIFEVRILDKVCSNKNFFADNSRITNFIQDIYNVENSKLSIIIENQVSGENTTTNYEDLTDKFLGLLKNDSGTYEKGAKFKSDGEIVYYHDIYGGKSPVGELLVDGEDALYQVMESSSSYNKGLVHVMKYILARYKGENVTSEDFDNAINWMQQDIFSSVGDGSAQECWRQMLKSFEDAKMTQDGKKYLLLDGGENDEKNSVSTAYGLKFYEEGYYDIEFQTPFDAAYKDCNINLTLKEALKDLIINGKVQSQLANSNYEFPEKYALPKEVVDKAMEYILSSKEEEIKQLVARYNKESGKNLTLTTQQIQAIADAHWQYVVESFDPYEFIKAYGNLNDGVDDKNIDSLRNSFLPFNDNSYGRAEGRWKLFTEGVYTLKDGTTLIASDTSASAGKIVEAAKALVELTKMGGKEATPYMGRRTSSIGYKSSDYRCASFVSEVLCNATGLRNWSDGVDGIGSILYNDPNYELIYYNASPSATPSVANFSESKNLTQNIERLVQPGDIVATFVKGSYTFGHVVIYIGNNEYAHHGGGSGMYNYPNIGNGFFTTYTKDNIKYVFRYKK